MKKFPAISLMPLLLLITAGCFNDKADLLYPVSCKTDTISFSGDIQPILTANCALSGCHDVASPLVLNVELADYNGAQAVALNGQLLAAINQTGPFPMPKDRPKLDDCSIQKISKWVTDGAHNN